jgi:hypothetical protein
MERSQARIVNGGDGEREAIRSYAAANAGKLPQRLEEITETPAWKNPRTARGSNMR